jgi:hypothetical protein
MTHATVAAANPTLEIRFIGDSRYPDSCPGQGFKEVLMAVSGTLRPLQQQCSEVSRHVEHRVVSARKLLPPPTALRCELVKLPKRAVPAARQNVSDGRQTIAGPA